MNPVKAQTDRLENICLPVVAKHAAKGTTRLDCLPTKLKDRLIELLAKRGMLDSTNLMQMLHARVQVLNLGECIVTNAMLQTVACHCPLLLKLDVNSLKGTRNDDIKAGLLQVASSCKNLSVVLLRRCVVVDDSIVRAFSSFCPHLQTLNISGCVEVSDDALKSLSVHCERLEYLDVSKTSVSDTGILHLVDGKCAVRLKEIFLVGCRTITDLAIQAIVRRCPKISILIFHSCPLVTSECRMAMEISFLRMKQVSWTVY